MIYTYQEPLDHGSYIIEAESKEEAILKLENNNLGPIKERHITEKQSVVWVAVRNVHNAEVLP